MQSNVLYFLSIVHFIALGILSLYGIHRIWLLCCWFREKMKPAKAVPALAPPKFPLVTVQLPLYNERFVAARLLDAAAELDWPEDWLEIQVLDDSTDDTRCIVDARAAYWASRGKRITVLRRETRSGYKAGALAAGLRLAAGEFIAIFDADFIPPHNFLRQTIPLFSDGNIGMVQTRWGFVNAESSVLTRIQALLLSPHFGIEHWVRFRRKLFFNFNGTAGVWRRAAISSAGGWQADTVTEDLDLSYRAQLAGWKFIYHDELTVPSELPITLAAFRGQQQRWAKGSIQTARKLLPRILAAPLPLAVKVEAMAHLLANAGWLAGALVTLTLYPTIVSRLGIGWHEMLRIDLPLFLTASGAIFLYFLTYAVAGTEKSCAPLTLPFLPVLAIGLAPGIALSVLSGLCNWGGVFLRTPKYGITGRQRRTGLASLYRQRSPLQLLMSAALFCYTLLPVRFALERGAWPAIPFLLLFPLGFLAVTLFDAADLFQKAPGSSEGEDSPS
jgi:cellulose synthase/poly-beta-1,6-N-acetylglucosamine synthase-like glycosyltransferase